jgi:hypothetical protein
MPLFFIIETESRDFVQKAPEAGLQPLGEEGHVYYRRNNQDL